MSFVSSARLVRAVLTVSVGAGAIAAQSTVRIVAIDGKRCEGALLGMDADGTVRFATTEGEKARPLDELRRIDNQASEPVDMPTTGMIVLRSGQTLRGNVRGVVDGGHLRVEVPPARQPVTLPTSVLRALRFTDQARSDGEAFDDALRDGSRRDLLFAYRRGDPTQGMVRLTVAVHHFEQADEQVAVAVEFDGKMQPAQPLGKLYAIVFGQGAAPDRQGGASTTVHTNGGPVFTGHLVALEPAKDRCVLRLDEGCELDVPWRFVERLDVRSDRLVYLSDMEPTEVQQTAALTRKWPWLRDASLLGDGLQLSGSTYERGLVLIPRTRLTFDLGGRFDRFEAVVGIDDRAGGLGHAVVRVLGDEAVLFEAKAVQPRSLPYPVDVSVKDVRKLVLEVDFGERLDLGDHCVFADARVVRDS
ncbi:MAG: NPCBM/NEW2 domain-containing protein [Planctomycetota bacterium]